jgi:TolA-binding protein
VAPAAAPAPEPPRPTSAAPVVAVPPPQAPAPSEQSLYDEAQALATGGRYAEAAQSFDRLARAGGPRAELALYERGRLLLNHLGDPAQARAVFLEQRRRFPRGSLRPDVDLFLVESLLASSRLDEAAREIEAFLALHPRSERADEVRLLRAHIAREKGDCRRARRDYDPLATRADRVGEQASYFSAYCLRELGDLAGARRRLLEYLERFPRGAHRANVERALGVAR